MARSEIEELIKKVIRGEVKKMYLLGILEILLVIVLLILMLLEIFDIF